MRVPQVRSRITSSYVRCDISYVAISEKWAVRVSEETACFYTSSPWLWKTCFQPSIYLCQATSAITLAYSLHALRHSIHCWRCTITQNLPFCCCEVILHLWRGSNHFCQQSLNYLPESTWLSHTMIVATIQNRAFHCYLFVEVANPKPVIIINRKAIITK